MMQLTAHQFDTIAEDNLGQSPTGPLPLHGITLPKGATEEKPDSLDGDEEAKDESSRQSPKGAN